MTGYVAPKLSVEVRSRPLTWGLCVATLNRLDALAECVDAALSQTRPPAEIVIVDASDDIDAGKARIEALCRAVGTPLTYVSAPKRSLAIQRNVATGHATADILFLIDDDAFLHVDCAEHVLAIYETDPGGKIAAVGPTEAKRNGDRTKDGKGLEAKTSSATQARISFLRSRLPFGAWIQREVLLMSAGYFVPPYDPPTTDHGGPHAAALTFPDTRRVHSISGFRMTVRREVALREPFDNHLLAYCPGEDLDATYRFGRHGLLLLALKARLEHAEVGAGRLKRRKTSELTVTNGAYLLKRNSARPGRDQMTYYIYTLRRVFAEFLKDSLTGRFSYPQLRGTLRGALRLPGIFAQPSASIGPWYEDIQRAILAR